jgi:hypothetical protein
MSYGGSSLGQLAQGLAGSAEALIASAQSGMNFIPNGQALLASISRLVGETRAFRDSVVANQPPAVIGSLFNQMDTLAGQIDQYIQANQTSQQIQSAWQTYADLEVQIAQMLQGAPVQPGPTNPFPPGGGMGVSPVAGLADQLLNETSTFIAGFVQNAARVPEGRFILAEAQQLQTAANGFRQQAYSNLAPSQLAQQFMNVNACWQRLGQRVQRISRGQVGPNIARVQNLGAICSQIGQLLGIG